MAIEKTDIKAKVKEALIATESLQYPDLLMYVAQQVLRGPLDEVLESLEKKGMIDRFSDDMGTVITRVHKKKKGGK